MLFTDNISNYQTYIYKLIYLFYYANHAYYGINNVARFLQQLNDTKKLILQIDSSIC